MKRGKIVLLSPHHDDIAFSIGGGICLHYKNNIDYYLVNIFNKSCYCLPTFKTDNVSECRNREDNRFAKQFSLNKINLNFPDSSLLGHTAHSETICVPYDIRRPPLTHALDKVFQYIKPDNIFCPLGIGGHIDHRMVKEICLEMFKNNYHYLVFYEDLPYAYDYDVNHIENIIKKGTSLELHSNHMDITSVWDIKEKSIFFYESQVNKEIVEKLRKYAQSLGSDERFLERIWTLHT